MMGKVIQGFFLGGRPKLPIFVAQPNAVPRLPGPPMPAFSGGPTTAQARGPGNSFQVDPRQLGLASGGGSPLPDGVRGQMEAALGADFSAVRVHVGPQAERIGAVAFTISSDIYFAPGRFQPNTVQGRQLLGHELAHVVQQRQGRVRNPIGAGVAVVQDWALEAEADRQGHRAASFQLAVDPKRTRDGSWASPSVRISAPMSTGAGSYRLTAGTGGKQVGSVMVHAKDKLSVEVTNLSVDPSHRERGIGTMLLAAAARAGQRFGKSKVTLAAQEKGSGRLTQWYKGIGFTHAGSMQREYPELEAPISRVLCAAAQRRAVQYGSNWFTSTNFERRDYRTDQSRAQISSAQHTTSPNSPGHFLVQRMERDDSDLPPTFEGNNDPVENVEKRREWFANNKHLPKVYAAEASKNSKNWKRDKSELASAHHKFPKRTLGWLWNHMSADQQEKLRTKLFLKPSSGANALKTLRSNLIPPHFGNNVNDVVVSDTRWDDPEHTGEFLDLVTLKDTGRLTPRSSTYLELAYKYAVIYESLKETQSKMNDAQATEIINLLYLAEAWNFTIEGDSKKLADYENFWVNIKGRENDVITFNKLKSEVPSNEEEAKEIEHWKRRAEVNKAKRGQNPTGVPTENSRRWVKGVSTQKIPEKPDLDGYDQHKRNKQLNSKILDKGADQKEEKISTSIANTLPMPQHPLRALSFKNWFLFQDNSNDFNFEDLENEYEDYLKGK